MKNISTVLVLCILSCNTCIAQGDLPLPGHYQKFEAIAQNSSWISIAILKSLGNADTGPAGCSDYDSKWKIIKSLKGNPKGESFHFIMQVFPKNHAETLPTPGKSYILLSYDEKTDPKQIAYMMDDTPENELKVVNLLKQRQ